MVCVCVCAHACVECVLYLRNVLLRNLAVSHASVGGPGKLWQSQLKLGVRALLRGREQNWR